ncbi:MAG: AMP-binding protein, partial [Methylobacteriaceae bacterium]|nr:AMP-binding protein [Methylobacteriaceae bacterium]
DLGELRRHLQRKLPDYMIPQSFVVLEALPLNANGKIDRKALPVPDSRPEMGEAYVAPRTPVEQALAAIWSEVLKIDRVGINDRFFEIGGHSLLATRVTALVRERLRIELPLKVLFEGRTLAQVCEAIEACRDQGAVLEWEAVARPSVVPLSYAQEGLWFLDQLGQAGAPYNLPLAVRLSGRLDVAALERSLTELVRRHESLRTRFELRDGEPAQVVEAPAPFRIDLIDLGALAEAERAARSEALVREIGARPFDLARETLFRVSLLRLSDSEHVLAMTLHHIVSDGWSMGVLAAELSALYAAFVEGRPSPLAEPQLHYADYALWQRRWLQGEELERQLGYWRERLRGVPAMLDLPLDRVRPPAASHRGALLRFALPQPLSRALADLGRRHNATLYMVLLSGFQALLGLWSGQDDIVIGSPIAGRTHRRLEGLIGYFVNMLALRARVTPAMSFLDLLSETRAAALDGFAHQAFPFDRLVAEIAPDRNLARHPVFQVEFSLQTQPPPVPQFSGLSSELFEGVLETAKFDLSLFFNETPEGLVGEIAYATDLFEHATIERLTRRLARLLEQVALEPERPLGDIDLLDEEERACLLEAWNDTAAAYPRERCLPELFADQAARSPDAVAVACGDERLSYRELDERSNRLAHHLRALGVGPDALVGLCLERTVLVPVAILGILKAGGAYLPLDPAYPAERLSYMLADAAAPVIVSQSSLAGALPDTYGGRIVLLDASADEIGRHPSSPVPVPLDPENLAYVVYTSGSTGKPKGVAVDHRGVVVLTKGADYMHFDERVAVLHAAPLSFDAATFELWGPLLNGGRTVVVDANTVLSPRDLEAVFRRQGITAAFVTTALFNRLIVENPAIFAGIEILFGGEAVDPNIVRSVADGKDAPRRLLHVYGPTEAVTFATCFAVDSVAEGAATVPIGHPMPNTRVYVVDERLRPVPVGVAGELCIAGDGLARGYLNR